MRVVEEMTKNNEVTERPLPAAHPRNLEMKINTLLAKVPQLCQMHVVQCIPKTDPDGQVVYRFVLPRETLSVRNNEHALKILVKRSFEEPPWTLLIDEHRFQDETPQGALDFKTVDTYILEYRVMPLSDEELCQRTKTVVMACSLLMCIIWVLSWLMNKD